MLSKGELLLREILFFKYPKVSVLYNARPPWLVNPDTGHCLELDVYFPAKRLAYEFQGDYHKGKDQKKRDRLKKKICEERKIKLIAVWSTGLMEIAKKHKVKDGDLLKRIKSFQRAYEKFNPTEKTKKRLRKKINRQKKKKRYMSKWRVKRYEDAQAKETQFLKKKFG